MQDKINEQNSQKKNRKSRKAKKVPKIDDDESEPSVSEVADKVVSTIKHEDGDDLINSYIATYAESLA